MKTIIAIAIAATLATPAFAFFDDQNSSGSFINNGSADMFGDAKGEGEATFGMTFEGTGSTAGNIRGNGSNNGNFVGRGDDVRDSGSATGFADNAFAGNGNGDASGSAKFSMNFSARVKGDGDFRGGSDMSGHNGFHSVATPYYYGAPVVK
jgi:hypothetical protein